MFSLFIRCTFLVLVAWSPILGADDSVELIEQRRADHFGGFRRQPEYHYRCVMTRTTLKPGVILNRETLPVEAHFGVEIFRSRDAFRMDFVRTKDLSSIPAIGWTHIFDGSAGFVVQRQAKLYNVYPASRGTEEVLSRVESYIDPLADVLGLSVRTSLASWGVGLGVPRDTFDVAAALADGQFRKEPTNAESVRFVDDHGSDFVLSKSHGYALAGRSWTCTLDRPVRCTLENTDWHRFDDGTWYPAVSRFTCSEESAHNSDGKLFVLQYTFTPLPPTQPSDFRVIAEPGTDIAYYGPGSDSRYRRVREGQLIDVSGVAHDRVSIRWDDPEPRYSLLEPANVVPLVTILALLAVRRLSFLVPPTWPTRHPWPIRLALIQAAAFVMLLHWSMWLYGGGIIGNTGLTSYSWTHNFLSDLGREFRFGDARNEPAGMVFRLALCVAGAGTLCFAAGMPGLFRRPASRRLAVFAIVCGTLAGWSCARIGWAPIDTAYHQHRLFVVGCFSSFSVMGASYAFAILLDPDYPRRYGWSMLAMCVAMGGYLVLRHFHFPGLPGGWLPRHVVAQKLAVYLLMLCMAHQAWAALRRPWIRPTNTMPH